MQVLLDNVRQLPNGDELLMAEDALGQNGMDVAERCGNEQCLTVMANRGMVKKKVRGLS